MPEEKLPSRPAHVLEDPSAKAVARVYTQAFLNAAASVGVESALEELTSFVDDVLTPHPDFARLLTSEVTGRDEKLQFIDRVVAPHGSEFFTNFLRVLARHERLELLPLILSEAWLEYESRAGKRRVTIRSAVSLSESQLSEIQSRLDAALPFEPILIPEVDESLLGGLVIQVGDTVHDGSLKTRIKNLRHRLKEKYVHEIQSGRDRFSHPEGN
ncbi:MAG: ATP synthase F1 subunit delta [Planctomycetota bacterium]|nr:MAG: ATP synthase F1 subunit delta [Planctomycetota bacterium]REK26244.1 MAG: ATP synthase F1 subunit delta [Planctomycetota bacterium]REK34376.1 MAG: ATP synthase F1 subunit delta [Planctomycetota bacterium]